MNKIYILLLLITCSCDNEICPKNTSQGQISIIFESGFSEDNVRAIYNDSIILQSVLRTSPSNSVATDFFRLDILHSKQNTLNINLNGKNYPVPLQNYSCYKLLILSKKNNKLKVTPTNQIPLYY
jgi:hypothetical protein